MTKLSETGEELTDIELAILLSFVAGQHCLIQTEDDAVDPLRDELQLIASNVFGFSHIVVQCDESTSVEDFSNGILVKGAAGQDTRNKDDHRILSRAQV
ncbi:MAG: hypothetical protein Q9164_004473 [Protoblastenia rupestris]